MGRLVTEENKTKKKKKKIFLSLYYVRYSAGHFLRALRSLNLVCFVLIPTDRLFLEPIALR
jgi:hypothetical protein